MGFWEDGRTLKGFWLLWDLGGWRYIERVFVIVGFWKDGETLKGFLLL